MPTASSPSRDDRRLFERRMASVFVGAFITLGVFSPFFPVWLAFEGLDADEIGLILGLQIALRVVVCPLVLRWADRSLERADVLVAISLASLAAAGLFSFVEGWTAILAATLALACVWSPVIPLSDAVALAGVRRLGVDYGRTRLWGSVAFIVANVAGGLVIARLGESWFPALLFAAFAIAAAATLRVPRLGRPRQASPAPLPPTSEPWLPASSVFGRFRRLAPAPDLRSLLPLLLAIGLVQSSHALLNGFGSLQWSSLGYSPTEIGIFWAVGVVAEVVLFRFAAGPMGRFGVRGFLLVSGLASVLRWSLLTLDLGFAGFLLLQTTHALTFAGTHLALQTLIGSAVAEHRLGAAQGTAFALQTGVMAATTFGGGLLYSAFGAGAFFAMAALAGAGVLLALLGPQPQRAEVGGATSEPS
jgi:PPP family 3-phenylpropionic acid transporter